MSSIRRMANWPSSASAEFKVTMKSSRSPIRASASTRAASTTSVPAIATLRRILNEVRNVLRSMTWSHALPTSQFRANHRRARQRLPSLQVTARRPRRPRRTKRQRRLLPPSDVRNRVELRAEQLTRRLTFRGRSRHRRQRNPIQTQRRRQRQATPLRRNLPSDRYRQPSCHPLLTPLRCQSRHRQVRRRSVRPRRPSRIEPDRLARLSARTRSIAPRTMRVPPNRSSRQSMPLPPQSDQAWFAMVALPRIATRRNRPTRSRTTRTRRPILMAGSPTRTAAGCRPLVRPSRRRPVANL